jgi:hypothetical protein
MTVAMTDANPQKLGLLPKPILVIGVLLLAAGVLWHGVTEQAFERIWPVGRVGR